MDTIGSNQSKVDSAVWEGKKILVVDDDPQNIFIMNLLLTRGKMEVITAKNGLDALDKLIEHPDIDLVFMDIMMPIMNGYEAMEEIRKQKQYEDLPIIVVTANMTGDPATYYKAGASDYMLKPVSKEKLFMILEVWLTAIS